MKSRLSLWALLFAPLAGACSCDEEPLIMIDPGFRIDAGIISPDAMPEPKPEPIDAGPSDSGEPEGRVLTFEGTAPLLAYYGASLELRFLLETASGVPVPQETIRFTISGIAGNLAAPSATTDGAGSARVGFTAGSAAGRATITAEADRATPVSVTIDVAEDPNAALELVVSSMSRINVASADAAIFVGPAGSIPTCAQPPSGMPALNATFMMLPGSRTFTGLQTGMAVTAFATGKNTRGETIASGCAELARLAGAMTARLEVSLEQLATDVTGDYDTLLELDLGRTLPEPYQSTVVLITDILSDPAGWAVYQTLALVDRNVGSTFIEWTPPGSTTARPATFEEVRSNQNLFNTWRRASAALDTFLANQLGQPYIDVTNVGADIAQAVRAFEVGAEFSVTSTGTQDRVLVTESWKAMVFQWQLSCPNGDLGCARRAFTLSGPNAHLAPAQTTYGATVAYAPLMGQVERFELALDAHQIDVRYGAIVLLVLNQLVFPNLPPAIAGNSLSQVISNIIGCSDLAITLANATGWPNGRAFFQAACDSAVNAAATAVENRLLALDSVSNPGLVTGPGGGRLVLVDRDEDLRTELVPEVRTEARWTTGTPPVSTPIDGDGRRAALDCASDADCSSGTRCVPIPSYLEVRAVEQDCRRAVGAMHGPIGCAMDADCASGICFDPGPGVRVCYESCGMGTTCTLGSCVADALAFDLDLVRSGLGDARVAACVP
jgi:hypothetical protein